jgi:hypothetical protein
MMANLVEVKCPPLVKFSDRGATSRTAQLMPCDTSFFTTHAPIPCDPPVMTATSFFQSHAAVSFSHNHLFSAQPFSTELRWTEAHRVRHHFKYQWIVSSWDTERGTSLLKRSKEASVLCSTVHAAINKEYRIMTTGR